MLRAAAVVGVSLTVGLLAARPAVAEVTVVEKNGWSFFIDGRINAFFSQGVGDDFPRATPNPNAPLVINGVTTPQPAHTVIGSGQPFTAGFSSDVGTSDNKYQSARVRSGFLGSIIAFGTRHAVTETTTVKGYISLWGTAEAYGRDRTQDLGNGKTKGFDVREGYINFDGPWGAFTAGHQAGLLGGISTEIDYLYGHNFGLGLPCLDVFYPTCGHIGTGALGPGFAPGFTYTTPSLHGIRLKAGFYDPVRLLGIWERVPYPRPEGSLTYEHEFSPRLRLKLAAEGMYQSMQALGDDGSIDPRNKATEVWGLAGGGRLEAGFFRLGLSAFRGKGLGIYVALQNSGSTFSNVTKQFRYFTGYYAQTAFVFGRLQLSGGLGITIDDQLAADKNQDYSTSGLKSQTGGSLGVYYSVSEHVVIGLDYFGFQTKWWGAPNSTFTVDAAGNLVMDPVTGQPQVTIIPGAPLTPEKQLIHFINLGATFHW